MASTPAAEASASRVILFIRTFLPMLIDRGRWTAPGRTEASEDYAYFAAAGKVGGNPADHACEMNFRLV